MERVENDQKSQFFYAFAANPGFIEIPTVSDWFPKKKVWMGCALSKLFLEFFLLFKGPVRYSGFFLQYIMPFSKDGCYANECTVHITIIISCIFFTSTFPIHRITTR